MSGLPGVHMDMAVDGVHCEVIELRKQLQEQAKKIEDLLAIIKEQQIEIEEYRQQMIEHNKFVIDTLYVLYRNEYGNEPRVPFHNCHGLYKKLREMNK